MATNGQAARDDGRLDRLRLRLRVARRRTKLDRALAEGASPDADPALELRATQLTARSTRRAIAGTIADLLSAAEEEPPEAFGAVSARPSLRGDEILASRAELRAVVDALEEPHPLSPQAAALAAWLVWDSASPMYAVGLHSSVADVADAILAGSEDLLAAGEAAGVEGAARLAA